MRFGSLFSGIGGLDLGLERAGMECAWQVEIDEWCRRVLARHWPDVPRWDDATTFLADPEADRLQGNGTGGQQESSPRHPQAQPEGRDLRVDLICGGFPCQPVSLAGKRRGQDDERWLWPEFARIVRLLRPRYVLVENVPGLLARGMGDVLGDLAACGYDTEWDCIPAAAVGAPHLRYRVFIVAHAQGGGFGGGSEQPSSQGWASVRSQGSSPVDLTGLANYPNGRRHGITNGAVFAGRNGVESSGWWAVEPDVGRVAHGVSSRVDRLRGLGNAVVPQVAEWIGRRLTEVA